MRAKLFALGFDVPLGVDHETLREPCVGDLHSLIEKTPGIVAEVEDQPFERAPGASRSGMPRRAGSPMIFLRGLASLPLRWDAEGAERLAATR